MKKTLAALLFPVLLFPAAFTEGGKRIQLTPTPSQARSLDGCRAYLGDNGKRYTATGKVLVRLREPDAASTLWETVGAVPLRALSSGFFLVAPPEGTDAFTFADLLEGREETLLARPEMVRNLTPRSSTDPLYSDQWHLENTGQGEGTPGADVNASAAWETTRGAGVRIGILDGAFDTDHPDLEGAVAAAKDFDDQGTDVRPDTRDQTHGTPCAGLMAARENGVGTVGVAPEADLVLAKMDLSFATDASLIEAIDWLGDQGVRVMSHSWGTYAVPDAVASVLATWKEQGVVIVFACGNDGDSLDDPGVDDESELESVIGVVSTTNLNRRALYSNHGTAVDLAAPSGPEWTEGTLELTTTDVTGPFGYTLGDYTDGTVIGDGFNGTSASAPIVAGVAALVVAANPELTPDQVYAILTSTADKVGLASYNTDGWNRYLGYGKVNAGRAVAKATAADITLELASGYSLVSLPVKATVSDLSPLAEAGVVFYAYAYDTWHRYPAKTGWAALDTLEPYGGYIAKSPDAVAVALSGKAVSSERSVPSGSGWFLAGVPEAILLSELADAYGATVIAAASSGGSSLEYLIWSDDGRYDQIGTTLEGGTAVWVRK